MSKNKNINLIIAPISFSTGSAGAMRLRYLVNELRLYPNIVITNLLASKEHNQLDDKYYYENVSYENIKYISAVGVFLSLFKFFSILRCRKVDGQNVFYYYGCTKNPLDNFCFLVAKILGYRLVFDEAELYKTKLQELSGLQICKFWVISFNQYIVRFLADHIFCISHDILDYYPKKSSLLPISYNSEIRSFINGEDGEIGKKADITLFYSGSFASKDDVDSLIDVCGQLHTQGKRCVLSLCGKPSSEVRSKLESKVEQAGINDFVVWHGFLEIEDYYKELQRADICVVPRTNSKFANTGFPFKLGEYLALGKACVVAKTGDIAQYLSSDDAMLVQPGESFQLEQAISDLIENNELRERLAKSGKRKAELYFDPAQHAQQMIRVFEEV